MSITLNNLLMEKSLIIEVEYQISKKEKEIRFLNTSRFFAEAKEAEKELNSLLEKKIALQESYERSKQEFDDEDFVSVCGLELDEPVEWMMG